MAEQKQDSLYNQLIKPFVDLIHAPRALWGINLSYVLEGMVYFGMLGYLAIYFSDFVFQSVDGANDAAHQMVMVLTAGITISMFFLGRVADKRGIRFALLAAFVLMLAGRAIWSGGPNVLGFQPTRPGVFTGDKIDLHVDELGTKGGVKTILASTLVGTDEGKGGAPMLTVDLSAGEGIEPTKAMESQLVSVTGARVIESESEKNRILWKISYGQKPVEAWLSVPEGMVCKDAVIDLERAYVTLQEFKVEAVGEISTADKKTVMLPVLRATWNDDFAKVDTSACTEEEREQLANERKERDNKDIENLLRTTERREAVVPSGDMESAKDVTLDGLRAMENGDCNVILRGVYVTQVIGGGYCLQQAAGGPAIFVYVDPMNSMLHIITLLGMVLVVIGYGMYQPAAYAGVRKFTNPKTAGMGFAMLYALMNLGGWFPSFAYLLRNKEYLGLGYAGTFWVYTCFTAVALAATYLILTKRTVEDAEKTAKEETARINKEEGKEEKKDESASGAAAAAAEPARVKPHMWVILLGAVALILFKAEAPWYHTWEESVGRWIFAIALFVSPLFIAMTPKARAWVLEHPLQDGKFAFFIFALIPVQTLFTYNWLVLPAYIQRAIPGWLGENFELLANANPILIFIAVPIIAALTQKAKVYNLMIWGTLIMAAPAFLNCIGPYAWTLISYILIMTIGEAMWQPRFLQYAAEIAPEGRTGEYMGVAQFPWFLTKVLVPLLYSGWMMDRYCPLEGEQNTEFMWFIFGCIAVMSTVLLVLARGWVGKDFKTKA
jgi:MFS family permease